MQGTASVDEASLRGNLRDEGGASRRASFLQIGYGAAALAVLVGWIVTRDYQLVDPLRGLGYWLGIVGASLMAVLLLYPLRKRLRIFRFFGSTKSWFRVHIFFGVVGPILILYHCNFSFGSLNSTVALACTILVAVSGLIGRYLYAKIHTDLEGHRTSLQELIDRAKLSPAQESRASALAPQLLERMKRFDALVLTPPDGFLAAISLPAKLAITTRIGLIQLVWHARREIDTQAKKSGVSKAQRKHVRAAITNFIVAHLRRVRRVAELHSYERLFSLWHIFHLPFFYILVVTASIHVLSAHMY
jgi:hypothetical protein